VLHEEHRVKVLIVCELVEEVRYMILSNLITECLSEEAHKDEDRTQVLPDQPILEDVK
jgi:hypothetical protein